MDMSAQQLAWLTMRWMGRGVLGLAAATFFLQWVLPKIKNLNSHHTTPSAPAMAETATESDSQVVEVRRPQQARRSGVGRGRMNPASLERRRRQVLLCRELQAKHEEKAAIYKEKVLLPRWRVKKEQKEQEFYRFHGPAWKGKGEVLGNDGDHKAEQEALDVFEDDLEPREMAAVRRRIQKPAPQPAQPPKKPVRVINLPEEPLEDDAGGTVMVLFRSPINTSYKRRFRISDTVQTLLDYMTVSGFTQSYNTLVTSFPRCDLAEKRDCTLQELGFVSRVALNIEEKNL